MIFLAAVSACGAAATGNSKISCAGGACNTSSDAPSGDQSDGKFDVAQRGKRLFTMGLAGPNHHLVRRCFAGFLARVYELHAVWRPLWPDATMFVSDNRNFASIQERFLPQLIDPTAASRKKQGACRRATGLVPRRSSRPPLSADPCQLMRPRLASNGKSQLRVCCDFAVKASRRPSLETAKSTSGPDPVVSRSTAVARNVSGSMAIFQMLIALSVAALEIQGLARR